MSTAGLGSSLRVLGEEECLRLLEQKRVGRLGFILGGSPDILPVNYVVHDGAVVFVTAPGSKLEGATRGPVVFEVDDVDETSHGAWSVVVHGRAQAIDRYAAPGLLHRMAELAVETWAPGPHPVTVRITSQYVTGRQIGS